jgi:hypothetical protein
MNTDTTTPGAIPACSSAAKRVGALDLAGGTVFGLPGAHGGADPEQVIANIRPTLGNTTWDTGWQPMLPEWACTGNDSYRTIWWGDLSITFETGPSGTLLTGWSVGDHAVSAAPVGPLPPDIGPATGIVTDDGIGIGSTAAAVTAIFGGAYDPKSGGIQIVSSSGLATLIYFDGDQRAVGIVSGRNDCGDGF